MEVKKGLLTIVLTQVKIKWKTTCTTLSEQFQIK